MKPHVLHLIGNGHKTNLWLDPWLPQGSLVDQYGYDIIRQSRLGVNCTVDHLIVNGIWDLWPPTSYEMAQAWMQVKNQEFAENEDDEIIWKLTPTGTFTVKSAWNSFRSPAPKWEFHKAIWNSHCIPKASFCSWMAANYRLKKLSLFLSLKGSDLIVLPM